MRRKKIAKVKPALKSFNCKHCGSVVEIKVLGHTLNVTCPSCRTIIDANDPDYKIIQIGLSKRKAIPYIPLNTRGKLNGVIWEVTGFLVKKDMGYYWREYLLFNPYNGYRWLVEVDGHFAIYKKVYLGNVVNGYGDVLYKGNYYKIFNDGNAEVDYVEGEFFWRVKRGDRTQMRDYIAPPQGLSVEINKDEMNWTYGRHVDAQVIKKAFKVKEELPKASGVGQLQPSPYKAKFVEKFKPMLLALSAVTIIQLLGFMSAQNKLVFEERLNYKTGEKSSIIKTSEFLLEGGNSNVRLNAYSPVSNSWVYADVLLVDADTLKGIPIPVEVSFYSGSDWSEGSRNNKSYTYNVPDGRYYLSFQTQSGSSYRSRNKGKLKTLHLKLFRDVPIVSNLFITYILIILGPIFSLLRKRSFEVTRWSNSDFSPYSAE